MMGGQNTYIPLKVNQSGVIPIIFASSILLLPAIMVSFLGGSNSGWRYEIQQLVDQYILNSQNVVYVSIFALLIVAFAYFYNSIAFDPVRQADQIRRQGGFIPGVRPGPQTEAYLAKAVNRITLPGAVFIAFIAIIPYLILWAADVNSFAFAGTSVLISRAPASSSWAGREPARGRSAFACHATTSCRTSRRVTCCARRRAKAPSSDWRRSRSWTPAVSSATRS
jgi:preprotein translocase subunit SecY